MLLAVVAVAQAAPRAADAPLNFVIIHTDDQPLDSIGVLQGKAYTPTIDRLAREGAYFANAYVSSSVCTPSRFSLLTGAYASRCQGAKFARDTSAEGMTRVLWNASLTRQDWTFPKTMQQLGYKTGMVGKWHIESEGETGTYEDVPGSDPADPAVKAVLLANQRELQRRIRARGFDYAGGVYNGNPDDDPNLVKTGCNVHAVEWQTKHALHFIKAYRNEPFLLYFAPTLLHAPDPYGSLTGDPRLSPVGLLDAPIDGVLPPRQDVIERAHAAGVTDWRLISATWLDDVVGAVRAELERLGLLDNTLILYAGDNGADDHGKGSLYQGGVHVPMIAYLPGTVRAGVRKKLVGNIDIAPTVLALAGAEPPEGVVLDGRSLVPLLQGANTRWRRRLYLEIGLTRAVVGRRFKYLAFRVPGSYLARPLQERLAQQQTVLENIWNRFPWTRDVMSADPLARYLHMGIVPGGNFTERYQIYGDPPFIANYYDPDQLYDLKTDPLETVNLAAAPEYGNKLVRERNKLRRFLARLPGTFEDLE